jgi:hypothetical protein
MNMNMKPLFSLALVAGLGLAACTNPYDPGQRALGGGLLGAGAGAAIGGIAGGGQGAAIGALAGGALGAVGGAVTTPTPPPQYYQQPQQPYYQQPPAAYYPQPRPYGY